LETSYQRFENGSKIARRYAANRRKIPRLEMRLRFDVKSEIWRIVMLYDT